MRFAVIEENKDAWPVVVVADLLGVSTAGYYAWRGRPVSERRKLRDCLPAEVEAVHERAKGRYGSPRVHAELKAAGHDCRVNTVAEVMRQAGIRAKTAGKFRRTTDSDHKRPVADNVPDREFSVAGRDVAWVADIASIPTREVWLYLAAVEDLYSRMIVGCGRWTAGWRAGWSSTPWRWRSGVACRGKTWWPTRTGAAGTRASTPDSSWASTASSAP